MYTTLNEWSPLILIQKISKLKNLVFSMIWKNYFANLQRTLRIVQENLSTYLGYALRLVLHSMNTQPSFLSVNLATTLSLSLNFITLSLTVISSLFFSF